MDKTTPELVNTIISILFVLSTAVNIYVSFRLMQSEARLREYVNNRVEKAIEHLKQDFQREVDIIRERFN